MSEEEETPETEETAAGKPTITIAENEPASASDAKPTITIAEKTD